MLNNNKVKNESNNIAFTWCLRVRDERHCKNCYYLCIFKSPSFLLLFSLQSLKCLIKALLQIISLCLFFFFFFLLWECLFCFSGDKLPFFFFWTTKPMQGYFKEEPTTIQWGPGNEETSLSFQAGIWNYAINYTRHGGWKARDEC